MPFKFRHKLGKVHVYAIYWRVAIVFIKKEINILNVKGWIFWKVDIYSERRLLQCLSKWQRQPATSCNCWTPGAQWRSWEIDYVIYKRNNYRAIVTQDGCTMNYSFNGNGNKRSHKNKVCNFPYLSRPQWAMQRYGNKKEEKNLYCRFLIFMHWNIFCI